MVQGTGVRNVARLWPGVNNMVACVLTLVIEERDLLVCGSLHRCLWGAVLGNTESETRGACARTTVK